MNLITGASGLLGTRVLFDLLERGEKVRAGKRPNTNLETVKSVFKYYGDKELFLFNQIEWVDLDLLDIVSIADAMEGITHVYHCAAIVSFHYSDYELMYQTNIRGTHNIVNACLHEGVEVLCHVSSTAAIGKTKAEVQKESNPWKNSDDNSYYAVTKQAAECEVWRGKEEGLNVVIVNPSIIIGPGDWNRSSAGIFKTIYKGLKYYTSGANAYVDVRDVSRAMLTLLDRKVYNERFLCFGENMKYHELFNLIAKCFNVKAPYVLAKQWQANLVWRIEELKYRLTRKKPVITKETARSANTTVKYSNEKIKEAINFEFTEIKDAVKFTCDYLLSNSASKS